MENHIRYVYRYTYIEDTPRPAGQPQPEVFEETSIMDFNKWIDANPKAFILKFERVSLNLRMSTKK